MAPRTQLAALFVGTFLSAFLAFASQGQPAFARTRDFVHSTLPPEARPCAQMVDIFELHAANACVGLAPDSVHPLALVPPPPPLAARDGEAWDAYRRSTDPTLRVLEALLGYGVLLDPNERLEPRDGEMAFKLTPTRIAGGAFGLTLSGAF